MLVNFLSLCTLISVALAASRNTPPPGAITVGAKGTFKTLQAALDSLSLTSTEPQVIFVYQGVYNGKSVIQKRAAPLTIYGQTTDTSTYAKNLVTFQQSDSQLAGAVSNDASSTISNKAANTKIYNINIKNTYGKGSQAVALSAQATNQGYYGVGLYGYQDTLLANVGLQFYGKCFIQGAVDYVFGRKCTAWFDGGDFSINGPGYVTASGRSDNNNTFWYVLNKVNIKGEANATNGGSYLGRPWGEFARVTVQNSYIGAVINPLGWKGWNPGDDRTANTSFFEFGNTGPGAAGPRAPFAKKATQALKIGDILGKNFSSWVDVSYLS